MPPRPLIRSIALWAGILSVMVGSLLTWQTADGFNQFGALELTPRVVIVSTVGHIVGGVVFLAGLLGWVSATHGLAPSVARQRFVPMAKVVLFATPVTAAFSALVAIGTSIIVGALAFDIQPAQFLSEVPRIEASIYAAGLESLSIEIPVQLLVAWYWAPYLCSRQWRLAAKLALTYVLTIAVRNLVWFVLG